MFAETLCSIWEVMSEVSDLMLVCEVLLTPDILSSPKDKNRKKFNQGIL
jgi:hypothetical protein